MLNREARKLTVDFGNSLPILKNGSHNVTFIDKLLVAVPKSLHEIKTVSCSDDLLPIGMVFFRLPNWYRNSAGVQSFPEIGILSDDEIEILEKTPVVIAEVSTDRLFVKTDRLTRMYAICYYMHPLIIKKTKNKSAPNCNNVVI